jgi:hypothetical protein
MLTILLFPEVLRYNSVVGPGSVFKLALGTLAPQKANSKFFLFLRSHPRLFFWETKTINFNLMEKMFETSLKEIFRNPS